MYIILHSGTFTDSNMNKILSRTYTVFFFHLLEKCVRKLTKRDIFMFYFHRNIAALSLTNHHSPGKRKTSLHVITGKNCGI